MKVRVRLLCHKGKYLKRVELTDGPSHVGEVRVQEVRDLEMARPVMTGRLLQLVNGIETDVLPELLNAELVWLKGDAIRLAGLERVDGTLYAQTWSMELL
ncbi:hypothetical protein [Nitrogeniibacter aestuarii]|uniref:hypothetical protein n=1 Tax=Nitrogeniibacter aestuarii TaxID=2815343 RepID=UPI001D11F5DE|nr:hypothetical protein [Nitrogeniibacter aestuarii]